MCLATVGTKPMFGNTAMKKLFQLILVGTLTLALSACATKEPACFSTAKIGRKIASDIVKKSWKSGFEDMGDQITNLTSGKEIPTIPICEFRF